MMMATTTRWQVGGASSTSGGPGTAEPKPPAATSSVHDDANPSLHRFRARTPVQGVYHVITGAYPTVEKDAIALAALQFQAKFGMHNPSSHKPGFLKNMIVEYIPGWCCCGAGVAFCNGCSTHNTCQLHRSVIHTHRPDRHADPRADV